MGAADDQAAAQPPRPPRPGARREMADDLVGRSGDHARLLGGAGTGRAADRGGRRPACDPCRALGGTGILRCRRWSCRGRARPIRSRRHGSGSHRSRPARRARRNDCHRRPSRPGGPLAVRGRRDGVSRSGPGSRPRKCEATRAPTGTYRQGMTRALARRLTPAAADRLIAAGLAIWALFDVPWWWRPPGHGGSNLLIAGMVALAALQSVPFGWRRQQPALVLALTAAALAIKFAAQLNLWSASAAVLAAAYGLGAYGSRELRLAARVLVALAVVAAIVTLQAIGGNHTAAIACALFATALAVGEITAAHRDLVRSLARQAYDEELASLAREAGGPARRTHG